MELVRVDQEYINDCAACAAEEAQAGEIKLGPDYKSDYAVTDAPEDLHEAPDMAESGPEGRVVRLDSPAPVDTNSIFISYYESVADVNSEKNKSLSEFFALLSDGAHKETINKIREYKALGKDYSNLKKKLPGVTVSGTFTPRKDDGLIQHSGLLCIDFDNFEFLGEATSFKALLCSDRYILAAFLSASNNVAAVIRIRPEQHREAFKAADEYFFNKYGKSSDKACANPSRYRFLTIDQDFYSNVDAALFEVPKRPGGVPDEQAGAPGFDMQDKEYDSNKTQKDFLKLLDKIEKDRVDLTDNYHKWVSIGFAIARTFPKSGEQYFQRISRFSPKYSERVAHGAYETILKSLKGSPRENPAMMGTIFHLAERAGIKLSSAKSKDSAESAEGAAAGNNYTVFDQVADALRSKYKIRFNTLSKTVEVDGGPLSDITFNDLLQFVASQGCSSKREILTSVLKSSRWETYHPLKEYFEMLPEWDGDDRILQIARFMNTENGAKTETFLFKWLTGVVNCLYGIPNPLILVLIGDMGTGKTEFFRRLFPKEITSQYFSESHLGEKDRVNTMNMNLIVFDDELEGLRKMGPEDVKSLSSQSTFSLTRKYEAYETKLTRIGSICGASNNSEILVEDRNRRYLPIKVRGVMEYKEMNEICKTQLMAQAYFNYVNGAPWEILNSEIDELTEYCREFQRYTVEDEILTRYVIPPAPEVPYVLDANDGTFKPIVKKTCYASAGEILEYVQAQSPVKSLNKYNIGRALQKNGFKQVSKRVRGVRSPRKLYHVTFLAQEDSSSRVV